MRDFSEFEQRVDFCESEIKLLSAQIATYVDTSVEHWFQDLDGAVGLLAKISSYPPVALRSRAGLIANELRATLDGLVWELADQHAGTHRDISFPIFRNEDIYNEQSVKRLKRISKDDAEKIHNLRPWEGGHEYLWRLHEADRVRKHQRLLSCGGTGTIHSETFLMSIVHFDNGRIPNLDEVTLVHASSTLLSSGIEPIPKFFVVYENPECLQGENIQLFLTSCCSAVREIIKFF